MAIKHKVISVKANNVRDINDFLDSGWLVKQMVAEYVSTANPNYNNAERGNIIFLLEKEEE